jgi:hypothetical protein
MTEILALPDFEATDEKSLGWRIWHGTNYMIGGLTFLLGSIAYFPSIDSAVNGDVLGGYLFTIGSFCFLLADITEWNVYRFGCVGDTNSKAAAIMSHSLNAKYRRAEVGLNFFFSVIGSTLYLLGSICFIPATKKLHLGELFFIYGSLIIYLSQTWKCTRSMFQHDPPMLSLFQRIMANLLLDLPGFFVDFFAGLGGLMYMIGTIVFQKIEKRKELYNISIILFTCGGSFFFLSGVSMKYRYYKEKKKGIASLI